MSNSDNQVKISYSSKVKTMFQQLSKGLMLPIAILPIAGLFLGIGSGINNALISAGVTDANAFIFGDILTSMGQVIFNNLAVLFAIAIAITFTDDAGTAALSAIVGWLLFNAIQTTFISDPYMGSQSSNVVDIAFYTGISSALITQNLGITSMNTSVFGGILVGALVAYLYNKFHKINLPSMIGFFSGVRFIPIITFITSALLGLGFILIWPLISIGINDLGNWITDLPLGLNAFLFGVVERALIPFGLQHVFYTPLWYTSAGGFMDLTQISIDGAVLAGMSGINQNFVQGDQSIWMFINSNPYLSFDDVYYMSHHLEDGMMVASSGATITWDPNSNPISAGYNPGQYMQGKYVFMIFGLPAAGAAMVMAAKKENRQMAFSIIGAAAFTSFLTGITEPIEFTFLFLAPMLFFGFHVVMAGLAFWFTNLMGVHAGLSFSGGIIDLIIYGALPSLTGNQTYIWKIIVLGLLYIPIYYFVFYYYIQWKDLPTPGRNEAQIKLYNKDDYKNKHSIKEEKESKDMNLLKVDINNKPTKLEELIIYLGGIDNLEKIDACVTRLRLTVKDRDLVKDDLLVNKLGAAGVAGRLKNIQVVFGGQSDIYKTELKDVRANRIIVNQELIDSEIKRLNNPEGIQEVIESIDQELSRLEQLITYIGGTNNLDKVMACSTMLRLQVKDRHQVRDDLLQEMGAAVVQGKEEKIQIAFGHESREFEKQLVSVLENKLEINSDLINEKLEQIKDIPNKTNLDNVVDYEEESLQVIDELDKEFDEIDDLI